MFQLHRTQFSNRLGPNDTNPSPVVIIGSNDGSQAMVYEEVQGVTKAE
jgi:hypothetical protein